MNATLAPELADAVDKFGSSYDTAQNLITECAAHDWARIAIVMDVSGFLEDGDHWYATEAEQVLAASNYEAAKRMFTEECGPIGGRWDDTGWIMYDADDPTAVRLAERITGALHGYPILDESDHSEREWQAMVEEVEGSPLTLPDGVDGADVLRELSCPQLGCITMDMVEEALSGMGYTQCSDCDEWLTVMTARSGEPLCRDCALEESRPETITAVPIPGAAPWRAYDVRGFGEPLAAVLTPYLDGYATQQGAAYREDVRAIVRGSRAGYRAVYGRAA
ncbi:hypothetical protein ADK60_38595 [Streptomyces sp. XY431]|uniref:hypothetical protein n=1 Tax=Streptomyces sp. XY431 TaxID=1415562 RepID=UPI0006B02D05|nr:hypothetical protein [Streptomyces sp. XY431]KOV10160.1 hypothetical protein ADK60_38595 [Streptomyces sp. XY431]